MPVIGEGGQGERKGFTRGSGGPEVQVLGVCVKGGR